MTDSKALKLLQAGNQQALEWFIDRYSCYVGTIVNSVLQGSMSQADVEEVTADVFVTLWKNAERLIPLNIKDISAGSPAALPCASFASANRS